jgi:hypothetical protein
MENAITCEKCCKIYKNMITYKQHLTLNRCKIKILDLNCKICDKTFTRPQTKQIHELKCKKKLTDIVENKLQILQNTIGELKNITSCEITTPNIPVINQITNNNVTNINNGNITNNTIIINNLGNEDISHITKNQMIKLLRMNKECPVEMIKLIHFNKDKPENHNIYKPNFKDKYVKYCDNNIWKIGDLMKIVTELYLSKMDLAEEKFEELKQFLEESKKDRFQHLLDNREEPDVMGGILKRIIEIIYNERTVITERIK